MTNHARLLFPLQCLMLDAKWLDRMYYMRNKLVLAARPLSLASSFVPSIWEKINEWRRRRQHSLDAVHATDNDNDRRAGGQAAGSGGGGWRRLAGITRKGIVAKLPSSSSPRRPRPSSAQACIMVGGKVPRNDSIQELSLPKSVAPVSVQLQPAPS